MKSKLQKIAEEKKNLEAKLMESSLLSDIKQLTIVNQRIAEISPIVDLYEEMIRCEQALEESKEFMKDPEMKELGQEEYSLNKKRLEEIEEELKFSLLPKDPNDAKNVIVEIRPAAGGEEAALFAGELSRMYIRWAESNSFRTEILQKQESDNGGIKEIIFRIIGNGAYSQLKYESGVHRVQRIPVTESQGRVHTSTATVAVLPEIDNVEIEIHSDDLDIDTYRAQGAGGQHLNTTDSAVRITHRPTGIVVTCQNERSQHKNKATALSILRGRILKYEEEKKRKENSDTRLSQIGTGDRSEKIRTYNIPQDRITDHRIKISWSNLPHILEGNMNPLIEKLQIEDQAAKLTKDSI